MFKHLNLVSQIYTTKEHFTDAEIEARNRFIKGGKYLAISWLVFYITCFILAIYFAHKYVGSKNIRGFESLVLYLLAATFNVPFLLFYGINRMINQ